MCINIHERYRLPLERAETTLSQFKTMIERYLAADIQLSEKSVHFVKYSSNTLFRGTKVEIHYSRHNNSTVSGVTTTCKVNGKWIDIDAGLLTNKRQW